MTPEHERILAVALAKLDEAENVASSGDVVAEERLIVSAIHDIEAKTRWSLFSRLCNAFNAELERRTVEKRIRPGAAFGFIGHIVLWSDRIWIKPDEIHAVDANVRATVDAAGSISVTTHPTLSRMLAGAILPGSALIPGFAFQKRETHDTRELYFTLEHPQWAAIVQVRPNHGALVRKFAVQINQAAAALAFVHQRVEGTEAAERRSTTRATALEQLKQLGELRDAGVLTEPEFAAQKAKILQSIT